MADCSAAGTTIDRAARAIFGGSNQESAKHVGSLFGHAATMAGGNQVAGAMPRSAPDLLIVPGSSVEAPFHAAPMNGHHHDQSQEPSSQPFAPHQVYQPQSGPTTHQPHHYMPIVPSGQSLHQQAMARQAVFYHQQQIMQQQMQIMAAEQQQQSMQQQRQLQGQRTRQAPVISETTTALLNDKIQDDLEHWHDGLEDELDGVRFPEEVHDTQGHDGIVYGASIEELAAAWAEAEAEYERVSSQEQDEKDYAYQFQGNDSSTGARSQEYEFMNKVEDVEILDKNWMEEGMIHFRNGNLKGAIQSFEMELQRKNPDNAIAWRMLGKCHAENDMDPEAIKCLEAAVDRDPYSPESLLALGVSYVNELKYERALENMKAWFTHNPKYAGMELRTDIYGVTDNTSRPNETAFEEVKLLLLSALEFDASDADDVHEALGVIYNVIKDYDAAATSLRKALEVRPDDHQLWNKLGATLANGSQSDQALVTYHRALQLKPKYARAWLNMAISHSNLQDHDEAARCYLQTLALNPEAKHCWTYLRMALSCAERWDLLPLCFSQDLAAFQEHFDFMNEQL